MAKRVELWHGARDSLPMLLGAAPFGLIFGTLASSSGLSAPGAMGMSLFVYAGSSQFIALSLLASGTGLAVIVLTTFIVNLRHALYAANLLPHLSGLPRRWRIMLAFWLTDETFAVVLHRYGMADASPYKHWYQLGSSLAMFSNWQIWTAAGILLGHSNPALEHLGLEFAMAATFTGIVVPMLKHRAAVGSALAAAAVAVLAKDMPYKLGLLLAAVAGVVVGLVLEKAGQGESRV